MSACSQGVIARVALADVAGHGEIVSSAAVRLCDALREHIDHFDQSMLIRQLNESFLKSTKDSRFATAFLSSFYSGSGELLFSNAGHQPPFWYRPATKEWSVFLDSIPYSKEMIDMPLGLIAGTSYTQTAVQLEFGDLLLLYTDGITETWDASGEQLGQERLLTIVRGLPVGSAAAVGQHLLSAVERFRGSVPVADDETVLVLERREGAK
jgi:phosphoserine phosphatase RsbU/P